MSVCRPDRKTEKMKKEEKWIVYGKKADFPAIASRFGIDQVTARIMVNRGVRSEEEIEAYLNGGTESLADPSLLKDAEKAVSLLLGAIKKGVRIAIASDYDNDGIFSGLILKEALCGLGAEAAVFTPDRVKEGYGLNRRIVEEAREGGSRRSRTGRTSASGVSSGCSGASGWWRGTWARCGKIWYNSTPLCGTTPRRYWTTSAIRGTWGR